MNVQLLNLLRSYIKKPTVYLTVGLNLICLFLIFPMFHQIHDQFLHSYGT